MADEEFLFQHVQFKTGQRIHTLGQPFDTLYVVHSGFLKTVLIDEIGNEQVLSFPMRGDLFGVDGIHTKRYASERSINIKDVDALKTLRRLPPSCSRAQQVAARSLRRAAAISAGEPQD